MKFESQVNKALAACPIERQALADAIAKADAIHAERFKIQTAIEQLKGEPDAVETRIVHGVAIEVQSGTRRDDIAALAKRRDQLPELARAAGHERDKAKRRLSQAVALKLADVEAEFKARTMKLLEAATALAQDADSLESAFQTAGLDSDFIYAVRFEGIQNLRTDQGTDGARITARLKEVS